MHDDYAEPFDPRRPEYRDGDTWEPPARRSASLPPWLARKLLHGDEQVIYVAGPRFNPSFEKYVTHPLLFVAALGVAATCVTLGVVLNGMSPIIFVAAVIAAFVLVFGSIIVLGLCCGYFTRLVATSHRLLMLQGYEVYRRWNIDDLPRGLVRYRRMAGGESAPTIDLDAMRTMLGTSSDQFVDAKTILAFGKQLGGIRKREEGEGAPDRPR